MKTIVTLSLLQKEKLLLSQQQNVQHIWFHRHKHNTDPICVYAFSTGGGGGRERQLFIKIKYVKRWSFQVIEVYNLWPFGWWRVTFVLKSDFQKIVCTIYSFFILVWLHFRQSSLPQVHSSSVFFCFQKAVEWTGQNTILTLVTQTASSIVQTSSGMLITKSQYKSK